MQACGNGPCDWPPLSFSADTLDATLNVQGFIAILPKVPVTLKCLKPNGIPVDPQTIGEHLKARRLALKLYQRSVALLLGVSPETVLHWEKGQTCPPIGTYPAMVAFLGYDPLPPSATQGLPHSLRAFRQTRGLSVKRAARLVPIDEETWARWERGGVPTLRHRELLARLLDA